MQRNIVVVASGADVDAVANSLSAVGCKILNKLMRLHMIIVECNSATVKRIGKMDGVKSVIEDSKASLAGER